MSHVGARRSSPRGALLILGLLAGTFAFGIGWRPVRPAAHPPALPPLEIVRALLNRWLACVYRHAGCSHIPGLLPAYAKVLEPQLATGPVTHADLTTRPQVESIRLVFNCPREVAIATYRVGHQSLQVHPNLLREPAGWQVFGIPEVPAQIPLPTPLTGGERLC